MLARPLALVALACACSAPAESLPPDARPADAAPIDAEPEMPTASVALDPNGVTPLAAELTVTGPRSTRVEVVLRSPLDSFARSFDQPATEHRLPIVGLRPDRDYQLRVTLVDEITGAREQLPALALTTAPLPADFPEIVVTTLDADRTEPGVTLFDTGRTARYLIAIDRAGEVVWYYTPPGSGVGDVRQLANGNLLYLSGGDIVEMDLLGNRLTTLPVGAADIDYHHEVFPTAHGTYLTLGLDVREVAGFHTDYDDPDQLGTVDVTDDTVIEVAPDGSVLRRHNLLDILDPTRIGYGSLSTHFSNGTPNDWAHANAVIHDPSDDSFIVSARHQDAVFKADRATGELVWILSNHTGWSSGFQPHLLTPTGAGAFEWSFHQHAPQLTPDGTLLLFDNGNFRATPFDGTTPIPDADNYSRAVEYRIDEDAMTVEQVWEYGSAADPRLYSFFICDADHLPSTGNVLITFGGLRGVGDASSAEMGRGTFQTQLVEVARDPDGDQVVWRVEIFGRADTHAAGWSVYRSERLAPELW